MVVEVTYPPGGVAPLHRHPVGGAIYIVEGVAESAYGNDAARRSLPQCEKDGDRSPCEA
jgi:quercetin dioxygenase-like cupin family protein